MYKKYEFTGEEKVVDNHTLHRIRALRNFGMVKAGDLGGWIESEDNLSHDGYAWVYGEALVEGNAFVEGNARVGGNARVSGNAHVTGEALVSDAAWVYGGSQVEGNAYVGGDARVGGGALVGGNAHVTGNARVTGSARVEGNADFSIIGGFGRSFRTTTFFAAKTEKSARNAAAFTVI